MLEIEGVSVRVVTPEKLVWLKAGTVRPQDRADAEALRSVFDIQEEPE